MRKVRLLRSKRAWFLLLFGSIYVLIGYSILVDRELVRVSPGLSVALLVLSPLGWGITWCIIGVVMIVCARWSPYRDFVGYAAAASMPMLWGVFYMASWLQGHAARAWVGAVLYAALAGAVMIVSGMVDPTDPV